MLTPMPKKAFITFEEVAASHRILDRSSGAQRHRPDDHD